MRFATLAMTMICDHSDVTAIHYKRGTPKNNKKLSIKPHHWLQNCLILLLQRFLQNNNDYCNSTSPRVGDIISETTPKVIFSPNNTTTRPNTPPLLLLLDNYSPDLLKGFSLADLSSNATLFNSLFNNLLAPQTSTIPWPNHTTFAYYKGVLKSGFRNQMMVFTTLILECLRQGHGQFLVESVPPTDTY
jgi:hypothetical protein